MIWREKRVLLIVLATILAANAIFFMTYRVRYAERVRDMETRLQQSEKMLQEAKTRRLAKQAEMNAYRNVLKTVDTVYNEWWSTPDQRLTRIIVEVQRLAKLCDLTPRTVSYSPETSTKGLPASGMNITFRVEGTYAQIRRLINLLEVSNEFVIIDEIALQETGTGGATLGFNLRLKTLFKDQIQGEQTPAAAAEGDVG